MLLVAYALRLYVVFGVNPVTELVNVPTPVPSIVLVFAVVGFAVVFQQTPRAVMEEPPSLEIVPPLVTDAVEIDDMIVVFNFGTVALLLTTLPLEVPSPKSKLPVKITFPFLSYPLQVPTIFPGKEKLENDTSLL